MIRVRKPERQREASVTLLDRASQEPLYRQIERHLREQIDLRQLHPGDRLPSIRDISGSLGVNHLTVRQAVKNLERQGVLSTERGRGTFVSEPCLRGAKVTMIVPNLGIPLNAAISNGVREALAAREMELLIFDSHDDPELEVENLRRIEEYDLRGAIIFSMMRLAPMREILRLSLAGSPVVLLDRHLEDLPVPHVRSDNWQGGYTATRHLIERGRTRIAFLSDVTSTTTRDRLNGYRDALADANLVAERDLISRVSTADDDSCAATRRLLELPSPPDAIFYGNDLRAIVGMQELRQAGLRVPDDIAVVGFDDSPMAKLCDPPLTTIRQDGLELGRTAAEVLMHVMAQPAAAQKEPPARIVPVELILRRST